MTPQEAALRDVARAYGLDKAATTEESGPDQRVGLGLGATGGMAAAGLQHAYRRNLLEQAQAAYERGHAMYEAGDYLNRHRDPHMRAEFSRSAKMQDQHARSTHPGLMGLLGAAAPMAAYYGYHALRGGPKTASQGLDPRLAEALKKWLGRPAAVGGVIGGGMGLLRGGRDVAFGRMPEDSGPIDSALHPITEMVRGGVQGAGAGVGMHAGAQLLKHLASKAGVGTPSMGDAFRQATARTGFQPR